MGTCRMSAGSGDVGRSVDWIHVGACAVGAYGIVNEPGLVTRGSEQQEQKWQLGAHSPPETSVGQLSSQPTSSQIADSPLRLNVSSAKNATKTTLCTSQVFHMALGGVQSQGARHFYLARDRTFLSSVDKHVGAS